MDTENNFEKKIKQKLEEVQSPYSGDAWIAFAPMLDTPAISLWKRWYMPYVYSTLLFLISWIVFPLNEEGNADVINTVENPLVQKDTLFIIDTVYVYKTIVVQQEDRIQMFSGDLLSAPKLKNLDLKEDGQEADLEINKDDHLEEGADLSAKDPANSKRRLSDEKLISQKIEDTTRNSNTINSLDQASSNLAVKEPKSSSNRLKSRVMVAPSVVPKNGLVFKLDKELFVGDTNNLNNNLNQTKQKPFVNLETGLSLLLPVSKNIDYYSASIQGFQVGLEWDNGWGIYTGAMRNTLKGEIDDDDIASFSPVILDRLPGRPADIASVDEVYVTNRQWFFPLELRWRSMYYNGFSFETSLGLVANLLSIQDFQYEFEENLGLNDRFESLQQNQFSLSHIKIGVGTNYLFSQRMGMYLRTHYWFPNYSGIGLLQNRVNGIELGIGLSYFLGK